MSGWANRLEVEQRLIDACDEYCRLISAAFEAHHVYAGSLQTWRCWARSISLILPAEDATFQAALVVRNAILQKAFSIVLDDIVFHTTQLHGILVNLPGRIDSLPPGPSIQQGPVND